MSKSHSELAHDWAHQVKNRRGVVAASGGNILYDGDKIFSYGRHFCIARMLSNGVVLFGTHTYSPSTSQHQSLVRSAIRHMRVVKCHDPEASPWTNRDYAERQVRCALQNAETERRVHELTRLESRLSAERVAEEFNVYLAALPEDERGSCPPLEVPRLTDEQRARMSELNVQAQVKREERWAAKSEKRKADMVAALERAKTRIPDWRNHQYSGYLHDVAPMLRLSKDKAEVQTSHGASIPVSHAKRLWPLIVNCRAVGKGLNDRPIHLGHFVLNEIKPDGSIVVGCHNIAYSEIELIAKQLGLLQEEEA